ncbi:ARM repeat-containing protein [Cerioporus squamosus]|nr:ARM repeat-containing protein [Cerioporus squamosus]
MDGAPPPEEDFSGLPISERLSHKNWKARVSAYEELKTTFKQTASDSDPVFKPYINNPDTLKKIATDANAIAQEKGLECLVEFVKFAGESAARTREVVVPALVDKCFGAARAGTKTQAIELSLAYVEVENTGAGVVENILPGLGAKQPKAVAGCVTALKEIVKSFGTSVVSPPPVLKALPKIFGHSDKTVRAEGTQLVLVLYQYIGPAIDPFLNDLKPVQVKELKDAFEKLETEGKGRGTLKPERMTMQGAREAEAAAEAGVDGAVDGSAPAEEEPPDPRLFVEEADIVPKLPANLQASLKSSKWKERKEALDELALLLEKSPRIKEASELGELARSLATCIQKDANINCVMVAAKCLEGLAKGLMGGFAKYRESVVPPMLERLKERKTNVTDAIGAALDAVFQSTTLPDILPDVLPALNSKNPQVKEGTLKFIARCLSTSSTPIPGPQVKPLSEALASLLEDPFEGARNEAAVCLGTLMKMVGKRALSAVVDNLPEVRKAKVEEAFESATVKAKAGSGPAPRAAGKAAAPPVASEPPRKKMPPPKQPPTAELPAVPTESEVLTPTENKPLKKPPARLTAKKPAAAGGEDGGPAPAAAPAPKKLPPTVAAAGAKPAKGGAPPPPGALDTFKYKHTPEDAEALAAELIPAKFATDLADPNWKVRLAALEEMTDWVSGVAGELDSEVVVRFLGKKGWNEKNFQVSAKLYGILGILARDCPSFGRASAALAIPHLSEKLGDMKLKKPAGETLGLFAEKTSLQFVLGHAYDPLSKQKAPKVLADALGWIDETLKEFGIAGLSLRGLIDFLTNALKNPTLPSSPAPPLSAIKDLLTDLNPQLLATINSEFDKVEGTPAPEPTRTSADVVNMAPASGAAGKAGASGADPFEDLFPRVEIDSLLKGTTILADAKSDQWKTRKEALETLQAILDQNKRLKPTMGEIGQVLKARVTDANKPVQVLALDIVARIATGMGKPFEKQCKFFVVPVASVLADQKAAYRSAALTTLKAIVEACEGWEPLVPGIATALEANNPVQRGSLLTWLVEYFAKDEPPPPGLDLSSWAGPIVACLDDRNAEVRKGAQALLPTLIACSSYEHVMSQANSLKPASKTTAIPLVQAARGSAPAKTAPAPGLVKAAAAPKAAAVPKAVSPPPSAPSPPPAESSKIAPPSKLTGVRRKLPQGSIPRPESRAESVVEGATSRLPSKLGTGLRRPGATTGGPSKAAAVEHFDSGSSMIFTSFNPDTKRLRLAKDANRWVIESGPSRKDLAELLQHQMEPHASKEVLALLFSHDHNAVNDHVNGLGMVQDFYNNAQTGDDRLQSICIANSDLALKFVSLKVHEPQSNLVQKCLDVVGAVLAFFQSVDYQLSDQEAMIFIPTIVHKLGDAREPVRLRVSQIVQTLPKVYAYSRVFQLLLEHGLQSKVAKTRQGTLDELAGLLKRFGIGACEPAKAFPRIAAMISDKDPAVRKSALAALSEGYVLVGEKIWSLVGGLSPKDKTQLEERLRRVPGASSPDKVETAPLATHASRVATGNPRSGSPAPSAISRIGGIPRPASPAMAAPSRMARPASPSTMVRSSSPGPSQISRIAGPSHIHPPGSPTAGTRPKSLLPSRLGPRPRLNHVPAPSALPPPSMSSRPSSDDVFSSNAHRGPPAPTRHSIDEQYDDVPAENATDDITVTISSILSNDPTRSVEALKKIQKVLEVGPVEGPSSPAYQELAEHTEGLIETITLQMAHVFEHPEDITVPENFRLAKHLIQTLNAFCDHVYLAESLTVDILTSLLEELTLRLLQTDNSPDGKVKDLSRFINMIILRLFATGRRMSIFRALFALLLRIVKPFPANGTSPDSQEARVAELVLKCVWKLARNIPQDLEKHILDPVELFPAVEHFLQSVPPNEWRARATNKVPCGDMPLRTIKVIIQHVVAHYADDVYDHLSSAFDDPSATIVYPYVYRILNSSSKTAAEVPLRHETIREEPRSRQLSVVSSLSRPISPQETASSRSVTSDPHRPLSSSSHTRSRSVSSTAETVQEPDLDDQLNTIIDHISSETTGAMHKEGITELHHYLKAYPHKKPKVDKILESTGPAFRKYITRALASRAAEDEERDVAVSQTLSSMYPFNHQDAHSTLIKGRETNGHGVVPTSPVSVSSRAETSPRSPPRSSISDLPDAQLDRLSKLHNLFQYNRQSTLSNGSSHASGQGFRPTSS